MGWFLAGLAILVAALAAVQLFVSSDSASLARTLRRVIAGLAILAGIGALAFGRIGLAIGFAALAAWILGRPFSGFPFGGIGGAGGRFGGAGGQAGGSEPAMTRQRALEILGLKEGASDEAVRQAHRDLMRKIHPDHGGSGYLAGQINAARDFLLGNRH